MAISTDMKFILVASLAAAFGIAAGSAISTYSIDEMALLLPGKVRKLPLVSADTPTTLGNAHCRRKHSGATAVTSLDGQTVRITCP